MGDDQFGAGLRTALQAEGVDLVNVATVPDAATGAAMIVVAADGENSIVVAPGANHLLDAGRLATLPSVLSERAVLALQLEIPLDTCVEAARSARGTGATVMLNAAPLPELIEPAFAQLLSTVDVLVVNETEALRLHGPKGDRPPVKRPRGLGRSR